jgi:hypothetical protein
MAKITGADTIAGIRQGATYGTAVAIGAGHKLVLEDASQSASVSEITTNAIGLGLSMADQANIGNTEYAVSINQQGRYNDNGLPLILALFFGASTGVPAEITTDEDDYLHRITWSSAANKFATFAMLGTSDDVFEFPSCYVQDITIETGTTPGVLSYTANLLANTRVLDSVVNTDTTLGSATVLGNSVIGHQTIDYVWMNAQGGDALDSGDAICPESISISYAQPKRIANCFGGSEIIKDALFDASITLNFASLEDFEHFTNQQDQVEQKLLFSIEGNQINEGENESITLFFPRLKAVQSPEYAVSASGVNPFSVTYKALVASANPTGMNSVYPYVEFVNGNSAAILA